MIQVVDFYWSSFGFRIDIGDELRKTVEEALALSSNSHRHAGDGVPSECHDCTSWLSGNRDDARTQMPFLRQLQEEMKTHLRRTSESLWLRQYFCSVSKDTGEKGADAAGDVVDAFRESP